MSEIDDKADREAHPAKMLEVDFALVVARLIEAAKKDPTQLRSSIYELARLKLIEQVANEGSRDRRRMIEALETAIEGVETFSRREDRSALAQLPAPSRPQSRQLTAGDAYSDRAASHVSRFGDNHDEQTPELSRRSFGRTGSGSEIVQVNVMPAQGGFALRRTLLIIGMFAIVAVGAIYLQRHSQRLKAIKDFASNLQMTGVRPVSEPAPAARADRAAFADKSLASAPQNSPLLPKAFGVYAISADRLFELEPLPGRAPDLRIAISPAINSPSRTQLPDGKIHFVVYRRDSANNAPERAEVRVIAKVVSAMTFANAGKPTVTPTDDTWVMRNITFGYRVAPLKEDPDMYEIRNESDDFALSPGRYALVVKGTAYDFEVAGEVTDANHCLQRIEAANGAFYSPCEKH